MVIKKFIAPTMTEALTKVKNELGEQAVILKTRMNRKGGMSGDIKSIEVTAAVERDIKTRFDLPEQLPVEASENESIAQTESAPETFRMSPSEKLDSLVQEIAELKKVFDENSRQAKTQSFFGNFSANMLEAGRKLIGKNLSEDLAFAIISRLAQSENALNLGKADIQARIHQTLCSMIPSGEPIELKSVGPTVVMFVGTTGAGKSSAIARVATHHKAGQGEKVAIITTDNFRADSSQQIKSFCRILGCPCGIVYTPEELSMAIRSQSEGLVLIDTPGINPNDVKEIGELHTLIRAAKLHEIHLVVSASTPAADVTRMIEVFQEFSIDKILITKLDETMAPGGVISAVINSGKRLSYISGSREIPGRFNVALPESLADTLTVEDPIEINKPKWEMEAVGIWQ
jgi:flagellar biosynthesis protein FlhF